VREYIHSESFFVIERLTEARSSATNIIDNVFSLTQTSCSLAIAVESSSKSFALGRSNSAVLAHAAKDNRSIGRNSVTGSCGGFLQVPSP